MKDETKGIKSYGRSIIEKAIVNALWTTGATLITIVSAYFVSRKYQFTSLEIILFIILTVIIAVFFSYTIYRKNNKRLPHLPKIDPNFYMIREERVHKWIDQDNYTHKRRYTLKALKSGLTQYTDRFHWTGTDCHMNTCNNEDYSIEMEKVSKNVFDVYNFKFRRPLKKDEIIEVEASWKAKGPARPFFSTKIEEPTDLLIMSIMLYPESGVTTVNCDIESHQGAAFPIDKKKEN